MAVEHVGASNLSAARKLLLHAAYTLRRYATESRQSVFMPVFLWHSFLSTFSCSVVQIYILPRFKRSSSLLLLAGWAVNMMH
jgi:hypothetical protein